MKNIIITVIIIIIVVVAIFVLKPNPEKKLIERLIRKTVDLVTDKNVEAINNLLTEDFAATSSDFEITKEDFENSRKAKIYLGEVESIKIRNISISISEDTARADITVRASSTKLSLDSPWEVNLELKKIDGNWLFDKAKVKNLLKQN